MACGPEVGAEVDGAGGDLMTCRPEVSTVHYACHFGLSKGVFSCRSVSGRVAGTR
jgi:hypothetical protein